MFTKAQNKYIRSLTQQKYRKEHQVFVAEGVKIAGEWLMSDEDIQIIVATPAWEESHRELLLKHPGAELYIVREHELEAISGLKTANQVLLVVKQPAAPDIRTIGRDWCLALDDIGDPGNMGTIIRIADWFGIRHVIASPGSVDFYNPKVIQAAMGSHLRVNLYSAELGTFVSGSNLPLLVATLHGDNVYNISPPDAGIIMIGNESRGISEALIAKAGYKVTIPSKGGAESLNAAVSAGILCALLVGSRQGSFA